MNFSTVFALFLFIFCLVVSCAIARDLLDNNRMHEEVNKDSLVMYSLERNVPTYPNTLSLIKKKTDSAIA